MSHHDITAGKKLRLVFPQWQGGNFGATYPLGARLLAWLAPESDTPTIEVPVAPYEGASPPLENGIVGKSVLLRQLNAARTILETHRPDRIVTFGGDCLISQAPFAYLNERYNGTLGVLWLDAHPDVTTPKDFQHEHAMVLGNLLGEGDPDFSQTVSVPIDARRILLAGVDRMHPWETEVVERLGLERVASADLVGDNQRIPDWIRDNDIAHLAIHLDLDVLDPQLFRSVLFANPHQTEPIDAPAGRLSIDQVTRLIIDAAAATDVVGLSFAEYMPWDAIALKSMMASFSILR